MKLIFKVFISTLLLLLLISRKNKVY